MTRIVSGSAKGRTLKVPSSGTRPTSERVREAMFSRLDHLGYIKDCEVLDLYAGSGALGLEAASRGARYVELVEHAPAAARLIQHNVTALGFAGSGAGLRSASTTSLPSASSASTRASGCVVGLRSASTTSSPSASSASTLASGCVVVQQKVETWLSAPPNRAYDLVFLDPPYDLSETQLAAVLAALPPHLAHDAMVVVERATRSPEPTWPAELVLDDERSWGDTRAWSAFMRVPDTRLEP